MPEGGAGQAHPGAGASAALAGRRDPVRHAGRPHRHLRRPRSHRATRRRDVHRRRTRSWPRSSRRSCTATCWTPPTYPPASAAACARFQLDPSTVKVDWALCGPVPWASAPAKAPGTVHIADSVADMVEATGQVSAGLVPARPFMLAGQMTTTDPTRSPAGHRVDVGLHPRARRTAAATPATRASAASGTTTTSNGSPTGCRRASRSSRPGSARCVLERRILGPARAGEPRRQPHRWRHQRRHRAAAPGARASVPCPGSGRAETGVPGLYLGGASAHPGGGVHGAAGMNAARAALAHHRVRRLTGRRG